MTIKHFFSLFIRSEYLFFTFLGCLLLNSYAWSVEWSDIPEDQRRMIIADFSANDWEKALTKSRIEDGQLGDLKKDLKDGFKSGDNFLKEIIKDKRSFNRKVNEKDYIVNCCMKASVKMKTIENGTDSFFEVLEKKKGNNLHTYAFYIKEIAAEKYQQKSAENDHTHTSRPPATAPVHYSAVAGSQPLPPPYPGNSPSGEAYLRPYVGAALPSDEKPVIPSDGHQSHTSATPIAPPPEVSSVAATLMDNQYRGQQILDAERSRATITPHQDFQERLESINQSVNDFFNGNWKSACKQPGEEYVFDHAVNAVVRAYLVEEGEYVLEQLNESKFKKISQDVLKIVAGYQVNLSFQISKKTAGEKVMESLYHLLSTPHKRSMAFAILVHTALSGHGGEVQAQDSFARSFRQWVVTSADQGTLYALMKGVESNIKDFTFLRPNSAGNMLSQKVREACSYNDNDKTEWQLQLKNAFSAVTVNEIAKDLMGSQWARYTGSLGQLMDQCSDEQAFSAMKILFQSRAAINIGASDQKGAADLVASLQLKGTDARSLLTDDAQFTPLVKALICNAEPKIMLAALIGLGYPVIREDELAPEKAHVKGGSISDDQLQRVMQNLTTHDGSRGKGGLKKK